MCVIVVAILVCVSNSDRDWETKKGQFEEDIRKTKKVLDLWEKEQTDKNLFKFSIQDKNDYSSFIPRKYDNETNQQEIKVGDKYCCIEKDSEYYGDIFEVDGKVPIGFIRILSRSNVICYVSEQTLKEDFKKVEQ